MIYIALRTLLAEPYAGNSVLKGWILFMDKSHKSSKANGRSNPSLSACKARAITVSYQDE